MSNLRDAADAEERSVKGRAPKELSCKQLLGTG